MSKLWRGGGAGNCPTLALCCSSAVAVLPPSGSLAGLQRAEATACNRSERASTARPRPRIGTYPITPENSRRFPDRECPSHASGSASVPVHCGHRPKNGRSCRKVSAAGPARRSVTRNVIDRTGCAIEHWSPVRQPGIAAQVNSTPAGPFGQVEPTSLSRHDDLERLSLGIQGLFGFGHVEPNSWANLERVNASTKSGAVSNCGEPAGPEEEVVLVEKKSSSVAPSPSVASCQPTHSSAQAVQRPDPAVLVSLQLSRCSASYLVLDPASRDSSSARGTTASLVSDSALSCRSAGSGLER